MHRLILHDAALSLVRRCALVSLRYSPFQPSLTNPCSFTRVMQSKDIRRSMMVSCSISLPVKAHTLDSSSLSEEPSNTMASSADELMPNAPIEAALASSSFSASSLDSDSEKSRSESKGSSMGSSEVKDDLKAIGQLAVPLMLQNVFGYLLSIVCTVAIGRLGPSELAASSMANSIYIVTGLSMILGLSTAMETLCGQSYGAGNFKELGFTLQRALLICWTACIPVALAWSSIGPLLVSLGQPVEISAMAARYLALCIPCVFLSILTDCAKKYLQAQRIVAPGMWATGVATLLSPLFFYGLVHTAGLGMDGAAFAFIACQLVQSVGLMGYLIHHTRKNAGLPTATWGGFSLSKATSHWGDYLKYGIPAALMISLEWWIYEIAVFMNGWLPNAEICLAVGGLCVMLNSWSYMIPMALGSAINTMTSNALGSGDGIRAKRIAMLGIASAVGLEALVVCGLLPGGFANAFASLVSKDPEVLKLAAATMPVLSFLIFWDGINAVLSGILRGSGQQMVGAKVNGSCFLAAIPLCCALAFGSPGHSITPGSFPDTFMASLPEPVSGVFSNVGSTISSAALSVIGHDLQPVARVWMGVALASMLQCGILLSLVSRWDWKAQALRVVREAASGNKISSSH